MKIFRPTYVAAFKCDGKACEARCCRDWRIVVDEETRQKYLRLPAAAREKFFKHVDESAQVLKLKRSGVCPFLNENFLCKLQLELGEDFLTAICQSFPRVTYKLDDEIFLQAMTLTCPVAAIEILLRGEPIELEIADKLNARQVFDFTDKLSLPAEKFLLQQQAAIKILQRRELSLNLRLKNLCEFFGEKIVAPVEFDVESHAAALAEIFAEMYETDLSLEKKSRLIETYLDYRENILPQLHETFSDVSENYLVNEWLMRCYPCAFTGDDKFNVRIFVTAWRAVEFAAVLTTISRGQLDLEDFLEMLCSLNDKLDHSCGGMEAIKTFAALHDAEIFYSMMIDSKNLNAKN